MYIFKYIYLTMLLATQTIKLNDRINHETRNEKDAEGSGCSLSYRICLEGLMKTTEHLSGICGIRGGGGGRDLNRGSPGYE
jgi:hypothetical protein